MKKKILLLTAATLMLVACGNNANQDNPVVEPSGAKVSDAQTIGAAATKLSAKLAEKKGLGLKLSGHAKEDLKVAMANTEAAGPFAGKNYSANVAINDLKGEVMIAGGEASAALSLGLKADAKLPKIEINTSATAEADYMKVSDTTLAFDATASLTAYAKDEVAYVDLTGVKEGAKKVYTPIAEYVAGMGMGIQVPDLPEDVFGKYKFDFPGFDAETVGSLPEMLATYIGMAAQLLSNPQVLSSMVPAEAAFLLDAIQYKTYDNGLYGIYMNLDFAKIVELIPAEATSTAMVADILKNFSGKAEALLVFSETEIKSLGLSYNVSASDLAFSKLLPAETGYSIPIDKISMASEFGLKAEFVYDNDVKVVVPTDLDAYKSPVQDR